MKPRVAFFDFAGCEGDQLQIANLEDELLDLLELVEVVSFREVMDEKSDKYDIAFIEGSCTRLQDEDRLKQIRKNAKIIVAIGSCATIGGINNSGPTVCRHYALFYDRKGKLQSVRDLKTITDIHGVRRWHRLLVPVFGKSKGKKGLYVLDKVNEQILFVDTARNEVTRRSLR